MEEKFIPLEKIHILEEGFSWLSDYITPDNEFHKVARNKFEKDTKNTELLLEIGRLNKKRNSLITQLLQNSAAKTEE